MVSQNSREAQAAYRVIERYAPPARPISAIPIGLFYKTEDVPALDELEPILAEGGALARRPLDVSLDKARALVEELL